ncbi:MAG: tRNA (adenosine(37)-N6)-dimethylallyltransferase MiaA [Acidimicrobiales bacterium]
MPGSPPRVVALVGVTASGKSALALSVAESARPGITPESGTRGGTSVSAATAPSSIELVSVDSMAVYRGMDIGTAKPSVAVRDRVGYHLVDLVDPDEEFTVHQFQAASRTALAQIAERGRGALLVGGTGLYLRSVIDDLTFPGRYPEVAAALTELLKMAVPIGSETERAALAALHARLSDIDPVAAARIEPTNRRRLIRALEVSIGSGRPFSSFGPGLETYPPSRVTLVGIAHDEGETDRRIGDRFAAMMDLGFLDEVRTLASRPNGLSRTARQALGYRELLSHIEDGVRLDDAIGEAVRRTRAFARRQWAWFRRDPRIVWLEPSDDRTGRIVRLFKQPNDGITPVHPDGGRLTPIERI